MKWLVKSEPHKWSWAEHVSKGVEPWDGVRNFQAAGYLRQMQVGEQAFFYHSGTERAIMGVVDVVRDSYPDPTDPSGRFVCVDFRACAPLERPVTLAEIRKVPALSDMALVRQNRLSVMPVSEEAWKYIIDISRTAFAEPPAV